MSWSSWMRTTFSTRTSADTLPGRSSEIPPSQWCSGGCARSTTGRPSGRILPPRAGVLPSGDLSEHVLRVRNWHYQLTSGVAYAAWAARRVLPADLPEGETHALDQWLNELIPVLGPVRSLDEIGGSHRIHRQNFSASVGTSADWPRRMIILTLNTHHRLRQLAAELGRSCPQDARTLPDPALLGWRLWSLTARSEPSSLPRRSARVTRVTGNRCVGPAVLFSPFACEAKRLVPCGRLPPASGSAASDRVVGTGRSGIARPYDVQGSSRAALEGPWDGGTRLRSSGSASDLAGLASSTDR